MIKCEVVFNGDKIIVDGYTIRIVCYPESGLFYRIDGVAVTGGGIHYDLSDAVKYCMEN